MKYFFSVLVFAALAFAANDGCTESSIGIAPQTTDGVTLSIVNDWAQTQQVLGLDIFEGSGAFFILGSDRTGMKIQAYSDGGAPVGSLPLATANTNCFGLAWNNDLTTDTYYTNDWAQSVLYYTEDFGVSWTTDTNPAGSNARGMDFDGTDYWCTNANGGGLYRFQPGVGASNIAIPEVPTQPSGLTVFPYESNLGIAVTCYNTHNIYFYEWDGSTMDFLGSAACPATCASSLGLAYSETTGYLYWSYKNSSDVSHIAEVSFDIEVSLERSSWGSIKTSF